MLQFGHIFCRSQQEEDGVKIAFFRHYAIFAQEVSKNRCGYTERFIFAVTCINTWSCQQQFARIDKVLVLCVAFKRMPVLTGYKFKEAQINRNLRCFIRLPGFTIHQFRNERANVLAVIEDQFAGINTVNHTIHPHITTADTFMHFGVDIQCGKQRIERAGGGVHHKCVVHAFVRYITLLPFDMAVFFMNL
ncbi:hypothetical protein ExPUPEC61_00818 [Escherichia coli]|nr:hypothetical protein ExPUPEC61_00818 [Escherichia coli]